MARKNYSEEFRRQAVDSFESTPGATLRGIAADLGIARGTLSHWVDLHGTGKKTAIDGTTSTRPMTSTSSAKPDPDRPEAWLRRSPGSRPGSPGLKPPRPSSPPSARSCSSGCPSRAP